MVSQNRRAKKQLAWLIGNTSSDGSGTDLYTLVDASGHLQVDVLSGGGAGEQYPDAEAVGATKKGNIILGTDGSNYQIMSVDTDGHLQVDVLSAPTTAVTGTFWQATQPVSGTISANAGTNLNTSTLATESGGNLATIAGDTTSIDGKITACNTGAVVVSSGAITETNSSTINNAVQLIDDAISTHDSAATAKGNQINAVYDSTKPTAVADGDAVRILADAYGRLLTGVEPEKFQATITSADATSAMQVKAKTAAKKIHILSLIISTDTAMNIQLQDDAGTPIVLIEQIYLAANGGAVVNFPAEAPLIVATNQDLNVIASAAGNISITITGYLAP